jgi:hypothetical protein
MSPRSMLFAAALAAVSAHAQNLSATQDVQGVEEDPIAPSPCCGAAIVKGGNFEAEANYSGDGVRGTFTHSSNLTLKYSLTDRVQVQVATANFLVGGVGATLHAFDGVSVGLKYVFLDQGELAPQLAFSAHAIFPTNTNEDAMQSTIDAYAMVYASKDVGVIHFDATASLSVGDLTGTVVPQGGASLTATWNFTDTWGVSTGPYSAFGNADLIPVDGGWFASLNFSPIPQLALSVGAEAGFFPESRAYSVFGGVAWVPTANARVPLAKAPTAMPNQLLAAR